MNTRNATVGTLGLLVFVGVWLLRGQGREPAATERIAAPTSAELQADSKEPPLASRSTADIPAPVLDTPAAAGVPDASGAATEGSALTVFFHRTGVPVAGVACTLELHTEEGARREGCSDEMGNVIFDELRAGYYHVETFHSDAYGYRVATGERKAVSIEVPHAFLVRGLVVGPDGRPVPGAEIWATLRSDPSSARRCAVANAQGRFEFDSYEEGYWFADADGLATSDSQWISAATVLEGVVFRLHTAEAVSGRVEDANGEPVEGALVIVGPCGRVFVSKGRGHASGIYPAPVRAVTDADGEFEFEVREHGYRRLTVLADGFAPHSGEARADGRITLERAARITGTVTNARGEPLHGALVEGQPADECTRNWSWTDEEGRFALVRAGAHATQVLSVACEGYQDRRLDAPPNENELRIVLDAQD